MQVLVGVELGAERAIGLIITEPVIAGDAGVALLQAPDRLVDLGGLNEPSVGDAFCQLVRRTSGAAPLGSARTQRGRNWCTSGLCRSASTCGCTCSTANQVRLTTNHTKLAFTRAKVKYF